MVIGPWIHGPANAGARHVGELDFSPSASLDFQGLRLAWYDYWLKGMQSGIMDGSAARIFLMGANRWLDLEDWPPQAIAYRPLYLRAGMGSTEASLNNGRLTLAGPESAESPDSFVYDPTHPTPSLLLGAELGPRDHRALESRMLTYTSDTLEHDVTVVGPVRAMLHALSSAPDTDWVVRLCDVWPDGRSLSVCDGIQRARYRDTLERAGCIVPNRLYRFEVDMQATAQTFLAGHRLRVEVTSSDFPRYDRNLNTGGPYGAEMGGQSAVNTLFHDALRPSHILLPLFD